MKYLGHVKVTLLKERQEYKELFSPLSESEYEDLRESIREAGILNDLILEKSEKDTLSSRGTIGRLSPRDWAWRRFPARSQKHGARYSRPSSITRAAAR